MTERFGWKPIETAPKDGTRIVLAAITNGNWVFTVDYWRKYRMYGEGFGWFAVEPKYWTYLPEPALSQKAGDA